MKKSFIITSAATVACALALSLTPAAAQASPSPRVAPETASTTSDQVDADGVDRSVTVDGDGPTLRGTIDHPEGGEWHYGVTGVVIKDLYSDYYHPTRKHGSSAYNGNGTGDRSKIVDAKTWSRSKVHHTFVGNEAFYRFGK